jgi:hypothetical protein
VRRGEKMRREGEKGEGRGGRRRREKGRDDREGERKKERRVDRGGRGRREKGRDDREGEEVRRGKREGEEGRGKEKVYLRSESLDVTPSIFPSLNFPPFFSPPPLPLAADLPLSSPASG